MKNILSQYKTNGNFSFNKSEALGQKCNAPTDAGGVYIVFDALANSIIYIGSSGWVCQNGNFNLRRGGMCNRIVNGKQFDKPRRKSWPIKMTEDGIEEIIVKWFVTYDSNFRHIPSYVEGCCIQKYFEQEKFMNLPKWNIDY